MSSSTRDGRGWVTDLVLLGIAVVITNVALLGPSVPEPVVWVVGIPFLLFLPGYALVSALFPEAPGDQKTHATRAVASPGWTSRFALSLLSSAVVVAVVGVALGQLSAIRLMPIVLAISAVTLVGVVVAVIRRLRLSPIQRARPFGNGFHLLPGGLFTGSKFQNATMLLALIVLVSALGFVGATPSQGEAYTESYLLSENESGDLVADGYPTTFVSGEGHSMHVGMENHEQQSVSYEVVVLAQTVRPDGAIVVQQQVDQFDVQLSDGESTTVERTFAPTIIGDGLRLQVLVYKGSAPENPGADNADQTLQLWIDVVDEQSE